MSLQERRETTDGSRPDVRGLDEAAAKALPLAAFRVLEGGDAFDGTSKSGTADPVRAQRFVAEKLLVRRNGCDKALVARVQHDVQRQLSGNATLVDRLLRGKPVTVDIVPPGDLMARYGFPPQVYEGAAGLFWDQPQWPEARIAVRAEHLPTDPVLVVHEMAHCVQALAFTRAEQDAMYRVLRPSFGDRSSMDEVFAIYSEREFTDAFSQDEKRAPGVYGYTRRQWNEDHLFTRFARKLWWPQKPLAGPKLGGPRNSWSKWSGAR